MTDEERKARRRARAAERKRERYQSDPEFRKRMIEKARSEYAEHKSKGGFSDYIKIKNAKRREKVGRVIDEVSVKIGAPVPIEVVLYRDPLRRAKMVADRKRARLATDPAKAAAARQKNAEWMRKKLAEDPVYAKKRRAAQTAAQRRRRAKQPFPDAPAP